MLIDSEEGQVVTPETETEETETEQTTEEQPEAEKPKETPEQKVARLRRQLEREEKKLGVTKEEPPKETRSSDLDYGEKAFLRSYDIKGSDELALVKEFQKRTGDSLDAIVDDEFFQAKLGKLREARASAEAIPRSTKRNQVATDDASYWQSKIETGQATLNDIPDTKLRREVLNRRIEQERIGSRFSDNPIQMT